MPKTSVTSGTKHKLAIIARTLRNSWQLRPGMIVGYFVGALMEIIGSLVAIYATAQLGNLLARYITNQSTTDIWFWLIIDVIATIVIGLGFWLMSFCKRLLYFTVVRWSVNSYMRKLCVLDYPDLYDESVRDMINKVDSGYAWQMAVLNDQALELCYGVIRFLAITAVVSQIGWWIVPVIILFLLPSLAAEARLAQLVWFVWDEKGDQRHVFFGLFYIFKQARAQLEIRSLQARNYLIGKIERMNETFYQSQEQKYRQASKRVVVSKLFEAGGVTIGSIVLIKRFLAGTIGFDQYLFLSGALLRVGGALNAVFGTIAHIQEPLLFAETFYALQDHPVRMVDIPNAHQLSDNKKPPSIDFKNVSFAYPGTSRQILDNLNFHIKPGEHVAIVGENGAGKSTLIKLILRFYEPSSGKILIDGHDLQNVNIESWYSRLATLFQDFNRYPFSVKENIALTDKVDSNKLHSAATFGGVDDIVKNLPHGFETVLDSGFKNGVEPSGGQYQRVGLARAFYRDASLLILDEPTAAIDAKAEYDIFNNIFDSYKNKTAIIVSHRFSTVRRADRIVVLDGGKIIEQGSHKELMHLKGLYHELFTKQAEGYK